MPFKHRRWLLPALIATLASCTDFDALAGGVSNRPRSEGPGRRPPNVLLIVTDDQRYDEMVGMRRTVRWLGRRGERFPNALVTTPLCCPSRASIFTGNYAHNTGVHSNANHAYRTIDQSLTVQAILQRAGYTTGIVGKYFNGWPVDRRPPRFDRWSTFTPGMPPSGGYYDTVWNIDGRIERPAAYSTDFASARAISYLRAFARKPMRPWFLYIAPFAPHGPATPGPGCQSAPVPTFIPNPAMLETDRSDKPPWVRAEHHTFAELRAFRTSQIRALCSVDRMMGRLRQTLMALHQLRNTLVIFTSDNGVFQGEHGLSDKGFPYLSDLRVPLLMSWPGHLSAGTINRRLAANVDIAPTILDAIGLDPTGFAARPGRRMDGRSLLTRWRPRSTFLAEWWKGANRDFPAPSWTALITSGYKYVEYRSGSRVFYREYYNLVRDPWELKNLLGPARGPQGPIVRRLHERIERWRTCAGRTCP